MVMNEAKQKMIIDKIVNLKWTTLEEVIEHNQTVKTLIDEKSDHFVKDIGLLDSSVNGVISSGFYEKNSDKLAELWYRIVKNHPFSNGNKRTAFYIVKILLIKNSMSHVLDKRSNKEKIEKYNDNDFYQKIVDKSMENWEIDYELSINIAKSDSIDKKKITDGIISRINEIFDQLYTFIEKM